MCISIIVPCHTYNEYTVEAFNSLSKQVFNDFELIIVTNSKYFEEFNELCTKLNFTSYLVIIEKGGGLAAALNLGISIARNELIARMDGDDICSIHRLQKQINFINDPGNKVDILGCEGIYIDANGKQTIRQNRFTKIYNKYLNFIDYEFSPLYYRITKKSLLFSNPVIHPSIIFRKSSLASLNFYNEETITEDYDLWVRALKKGLSLIILKERLIKIRIHEKQSSTSTASTFRCFQIAIMISKYCSRETLFLGLIASITWALRGVFIFLKSNLRKIKVSPRGTR